MKETSNITLALPRETLKRVRLLAVERETSVSGLLRQTLERLLAEDDAYAEARTRFDSELGEPRDLGTGGRVSWSRDSLHER